MQRKNIIIIVILCVIILLTGYEIRELYASENHDTDTVTPIIIGTSLTEVSGLIFIAEEEGFFAGNGLNATILLYDAGILAMDDLYAGRIDVATTSEFVFAGSVLDDKKIRGIASIGKSDSEYIVARNDTGIRNVSDLKGKKIGVAKGTSAEFYLGRFLTLHGIQPEEVTLVNLKPGDMVDPLIHGDIDAVSTWDPYAYAVLHHPYVNATAWGMQCGQYMYWMVLCRDDFITSHPELMNRFLQSLCQAEDFFVSHPAEARRIIQKRLGSDDAYMERIWSKTECVLSLDQALIVALEDETRWLTQQNGTDTNDMPVFLDYISSDALDYVQPESVTIIR